MIIQGCFEGESEIDEGVLFMPNSENLLWRLMTEQNENPYLGELEHYHNFSRSRLIVFLKECRFQSVMYEISERYCCSAQMDFSQNAS